MTPAQIASYLAGGDVPAGVVQNFLNGQWHHLDPRVSRYLKSCAQGLSALVPGSVVRRGGDRYEIRYDREPEHRGCRGTDRRIRVTNFSIYAAPLGVVRVHLDTSVVGRGKPYESRLVPGSREVEFTFFQSEFPALVQWLAEVCTSNRFPELPAGILACCDGGVVTSQWPSTSVYGWTVDAWAHANAYWAVYKERTRRRKALAAFRSPVAPEVSK